MSDPTGSSGSGKLRLVIISDTHGVYDQPIPDGDVLIHCGDSQASPAALDAWVGAHQHKHKLVISGNMDRAYDAKRSDFRQVKYLQDSSVVIDGLTFYGSPWTPEFVGAFQLRNQREAADVWARVPDGVDVLITHGPPAGILDRTSRGSRVGDRALLNLTKRVRPRIHCFGHVHESYGTLRSTETLFCNAAVFNGYPAVVVDISTGEDREVELCSEE